ncbi:hypothetical protein NBT05_12380 [Aquimarina sp. ERC-38]|uniref:hypothetical protein n=1 Tax=Aquimarina sp. ERC-38 TaxID=2949996 RepID=UPI00224858C5|nr:hypothetical protein [Aquimarina sp. ERC-38]UZO79745.1 hypothetical protein NBT05_12380 [Aquimarina sp. ERC-38]
MKTNDALLCHLVANYTTLQKLHPKYQVDELLYSPKKIKVGVNEVVFIHYIEIKSGDFNLQITTPTRAVRLTPDNTTDHKSNTIIQAIGNIHFSSKSPVNFYVQVLRIQY